MLTGHYSKLSVDDISRNGKFLYLNITGARKINVARHILKNVPSVEYVCFGGSVFTRTTIARYDER